MSKMSIQQASEDEKFSDHLTSIFGEMPPGDSESDSDENTNDSDGDGDDDERTEAKSEEDYEGDGEGESETEKEEDEEEPGNLRLESSDEKSKKDTHKEEDGHSEAEKRLAAAEKREESLRAELSKLRRERREAALAASRISSPSPTRQEMPESGVSSDPSDQSAKGRIPVVVSEDGSSVYVDDAKLAETVEERARQIVEEAMRPSPEQIRAVSEQQLAQSFIGADPEKNRPVYEAAHNADEYISEALALEAERQGFQPQSIQDVQEFIHQTGISSKVEEFFPEISPLLDEFVAAYASDNLLWKRSVLDRIAASFVTSDTEIGTRGESRRIESVSRSPRSLARKGGTRSVSPSSDEKEFESLEKEFRKDPLMFPEKKLKRYEDLGKKLGISGME